MKSLVVATLLACAAGLPASSVLAEQESCDGGCLGAAKANASSLHRMPVNLFGKEETGWDVYSALVAREIATGADASDARFASSVATWQRMHGLHPTGVVDAHTLTRMKQGWQQERPFVRLRGRGICPQPPSSAALTTASPDESYGKTIEVLPEALAAYRRLVKAAHGGQVVLAGSPILRIFSGFRAPSYDDGRCKRQKNCDGTRRAKCSNHRTGSALDLYLGAAPGFAPDDTSQANREFVVRSAAYRWLLDNAGGFGFVNYAYEPWHWEYVGGH